MASIKEIILKESSNTNKIHLYREEIIIRKKKDENKVF
jgi:hypothetical protein